MSEPKTPVFRPDKPFVEVRDRTMPNVKYQQNNNLFDRRQAFVQKANIAIAHPEPKKPESVIRSISERRIGTTKSKESSKVPVVVNSAVNGVIKPRISVGRPRKTKSVDAVLQQNARENAAAKAAESAAA
jgi:hypothetical protein